MKRCRTVIQSVGSIPSWPFLSSAWSPSIDPVLMIRMLIIGYVFALRSERALCRDVQVNLAYRWFCGLSIEDKIPDHSAFSRARNERFCDSGIFRSVFERVVGACIGAGLDGGEGFAVDASLIVADANKQRSIPGPKWNKQLDAQAVSRATKEYLAKLDDAAFGAASEVTPKFVSPSDPAAQWTGAMRGPAFFAYADNYLVDVKSGNSASTSNRSGSQPILRMGPVRLSTGWVSRQDRSF
jgi:transposase